MGLRETREIEADNPESLAALKNSGPGKTSTNALPRDLLWLVALMMAILTSAVIFLFLQGQNAYDRQEAAMQLALEKFDKGVTARFALIASNVFAAVQNSQDNELSIKEIREKIIPAGLESARLERDGAKRELIEIFKKQRTEYLGHQSLNLVKFELLSKAANLGASESQSAPSISRNAPITLRLGEQAIHLSDDDLLTLQNRIQSLLTNHVD